MGIEVWHGQGALRVEERLLGEARAWHAAVREDPARLGHPLCILVPSKSLKDHVSATLVREVGTLAGVAVQTHFGTALQILERAGVAAPAGSELVGVLVRQLGGRVPALRAVLHDLDDGYDAVLGAVSDLLDAGLDESNAIALKDLFEDARGGSRARAAGVVEVALAVQAELRASGLGRLPDVVVQAREAVEAQPELFAPGRLLLHGFADATGLVSDFLGALLRGREACVLVDRPPDPAEPSRPDLGVAFVRPLAETLAMASASPPEVDPEPPPEVDLRFFRAPGSDAEVRAVAERILGLLARGVCEETIGVVTRTPHLYMAPLRTQLARLGLPFSGAGIAGPRSALGRRIAFVLALLRERERLPADRFVLALRCLGPGQRADLRLGLHALGVARLVDLASPALAAPLGEKPSLPLPVRRGLAVGDQEGEEGDESATPPGPRAKRRHLSRELLERGGEVAREVAAQIADSEASRPLGERLDALVALLEQSLGWPREGRLAPLFTRLETLRAELPSDLPVTLDELALLLDRGLSSLAHEALGGKGGGVQVLDVTEARGRTFSHLFLLGANRDHFPRVICEDPLLPDAVRRELQAVLPELPVKERGHDEERFLFAELLSASPEVTVSWQILGDDGKAKAASPLVVRLLGPKEEPPLVPTAFAPAAPYAPDSPDPPDPLIRPAHEWALQAGLHGSRSQAVALAPLALAEARGEAAASEAIERVAAVRCQAVAELDAYHPADPLLGPYFGHVGPPTEAADLRRGDLYVTHVEGIARCPWRGFLSRLLRLERPPDALEALPEADALLVGSLVHAVLERIVTEHVPEAPAPERLAATLPAAVPWPERARLEGLVVEEARRLLFEAGIGIPGFASLLAEVVRPYLEAARQRDWGAGPPAVVAAEASARVAVPTGQGERTLAFRADRVDRNADGLALTDYKTGKTLKDARGEDTRRNAFLTEVRAGRALQAATYARLASGARGRFLYLKPDVPDDSREFPVGPEDADLQAALEAAVSDVVGALEEGTLVPRLVDATGEEPSTCEWCELAVACVRGDSGARRRLTRWAESRARGEGARARALRAVWSMGSGE